MKIFKDVLLPVLGALDPTGIVNALRPDKISKAAGVTESVVEAVLKAATESEEFQQMQMEHAEAMAEGRQATLKALDTGENFSFWKGLLGSPRRYAVTILVTVIAFLGLIAGLNAIVVKMAVADPVGFADILKVLGGTLALVTTGYVSKYFSKNGG